METKRFIGNDMGRIFARVRRELGPDAVIVQTRSLLRDGADPLIEVLAAPSAGGEDTLTLALQKLLVESSLERVEAPAGRGLTVGDLEDMAARESRAEPAPRPIEAVAARPPEPPEWLEGFVSTRGETLPPRLAELLYGDQSGNEPALDAIAPFQAPVVAPPPPVEWTPRPRINTRRDSDPAPERPAREQEAPAAAATRRFAPVEPGIAGKLLAAGFSPAAARAVAESAEPSAGVEEALAGYLAAARVDYPTENRTAIITIQGAPGSGRTTALMRMALDCADSGREAILVAADSSHTGGRAQVHGYAEAIGLPVFDAFSPKDLVAAVTRAPKGACIFVDVSAGSWSPPPIPGVQHFVYLAVPAHWDSAVVEAELAEFEPAHCAGVVLTGTDLAAGLAPALSIVIESGLGAAFLSSGRDVGTGIAVAEPFTLASGVFTTSTRETSNGRLAVTA